MATLTELRDERTTNNSGDRVGTGLRSVGTRETVPDEYDKHYSDTYGTTLTQSQLDSINDNQSKFKASVATAKDELNTKSTEVEGLYATNKGKLSSALSSIPVTFEEYNTKDLYDTTYKSISEQLKNRYGGGGSKDDSFIDWVSKDKTTDAIQDKYIENLNKTEGFSTFYSDWVSENTVPVTVVDPNNPSGKKVYMVDKDTVNSNLATIDFQGYGGIVKRPDGSLLISSDIYAKTLQKKLDDYSRELTIGLGNAYIPAAKTSLEEGLTSLDSEYSLALDSLASRQKQIGMYEEENATALNTIRTTYASKLADIKDTVNSLVHG